MAIGNDTKAKADTTTSTVVDSNASTSLSISTNSPSISLPLPSAEILSAGVVMASNHKDHQPLPPLFRPPHLQSPQPVTSSLSSVTLTTTSCVPVCSTGGMTMSDYHNRYPSSEVDVYIEGNCMSGEQSINNNSNCFASDISNNNGEIVNDGGFFGSTNSATSNKSDTSSIGSVNGFIKKNVSSNALVNSREDITSLGGASSITSHQSASSSYHKRTKGR